MSIFGDWFKEVSSDILVIDETESGLEIEARNNLWSFSISSDQIQGLTKFDVTVFLEDVIESRRQQIIQQFSGQHSMIFYCWHDEQAGQLRFSLVSVSHGCLPFHAHVEVRDKLEYIAERFLLSPYHEGLPIDEFKPQVEESSQGIGTRLPKTLQVWTKRLP